MIRRAALMGGLITTVLAATASAQAPTDRTLRVSVGAATANPNGASADPSVSGDGSFLAFDSAASNLVANDANGATRDVFARNLNGSATTLVSAASGGANGDSFEPSVAADQHSIAFTSDASNLVAGDTNNASDVFVRDPTGAIQRVSLTAEGGQADGPSVQPDISADGRYVVFSSTATNLVRGDSNNAADIYVRDLVTRSTLRLSVGRGTKQSDGDSVKPAIAAGGGAVSFSSAADNLVDNDHNQLPDVFVRDLRSHRTEQASVSSAGRAQNAAVDPSFTQVSDLSGDGKVVVFDSDATNLVAGDGNEDTDVYVRDRTAKTTTRASLDSAGVEGDNDSFNPTVTIDGRIVAFESFAGNLAPGDAPREDIFVRDRERGTTTVANVPNAGGQRNPEVAPKALLQRPALDATGSTAAFVSGADNLVEGDANGAEDVFVRHLQPATATVSASTPQVSGARATVTLSADDPAAGPYLCAVDDKIRRLCFSGTFRTPPLKPGRHVLRVYAGAPGYWFGDTPAEQRFRVPGNARG